MLEKQVDKNTKEVSQQLTGMLITYLFLKYFVKLDFGAYFVQNIENNQVMQYYGEYDQLTGKQDSHRIDRVNYDSKCIDSLDKQDEIKSTLQAQNKHDPSNSKQTCEMLFNPFPQQMQYLKAVEDQNMLVEEQVFIIVRYQFKRFNEERDQGCFIPRKWDITELSKPDLILQCLRLEYRQEMTFKRDTMLQFFSKDIGYYITYSVPFEISSRIGFIVKKFHTEFIDGIHKDQIGEHNSGYIDGVKIDTTNEAGEYYVKHDSRLSPQLDPHNGTGLDAIAQTKVGSVKDVIGNTEEESKKDINNLQGVQDSIYALFYGTKKDNGNGDDKSKEDNDMDKSKKTKLYQRQKEVAQRRNKLNNYTEGNSNSKKKNINQRFKNKIRMENKFDESKDIKNGSDNSSQNDQQYSASDSNLDVSLPEQLTTDNDSHISQSVNESLPISGKNGSQLSQPEIESNDSEKNKSLSKFSNQNSRINDYSPLQIYKVRQYFSEISNTPHQIVVEKLLYKTGITNQQSMQKENLDVKPSNYEFEHGTNNLEFDEITSPVRDDIMDEEIRDNQKQLNLIFIKDHLHKGLHIQEIAGDALTT